MLVSIASQFSHDTIEEESRREARALGILAILWILKYKGSVT